jgi:hypothetical protein
MNYAKSATVRGRNKLLLEVSASFKIKYSRQFPALERKKIYV